MPTTVYLLLALLSWAGLGIFHKLADFRNCKPLAITVVLFFFASLVLWIYTLGIKVGVENATLFPPFTTDAVILAAVFGFLACLGILTFQIGIRYGSITTSWLIVNLSTLVPAILSLVIYREYETEIQWQQLMALALIFISVFCLWRDKVIEIEHMADAESEKSSGREHADVV